MQFTLFSIVTGTNFCTVPFKQTKGNTKHATTPQGCQFCVSGMYATKENTKAPEINHRNLRKAIQLAEGSKVQTVILTGRGEPTLFPRQITGYLRAFGGKFPFIELQTNGVPLAKNSPKYEKYLKEWYDLGLSTILISSVSDDQEIQRRNYTPLSDSYYDQPELIKRLRNIGYTVRLACVCTQQWLGTREQLESYLEYVKAVGVGQVTLRPVNMEYRRESARKCIEQNQLTEDTKAMYHSFLKENGNFLYDIPNVGSVYSYKGVSVMVSVPLTRDTSSTEGGVSRNLIFFPDGEIRYDWEDEGAILLQGDNRETVISDGLSK